MSRIRAGLVSSVWVSLLFVALFGVVLNVPVVRGSGTIYIRADGSIDPPTAPIQRERDLFTFVDTVTEALVIERDNTIVDGAGYKLQGIGASNSKGIYLPGRSNVVIRNMEISAFEYGVYLNRSQNIRMIENNITNGIMNSRGILLDSSSNNAILRNNITNNFVGIGVYSSSNNTILENNITDNGYGLYFSSSSDNTISGNNIVKNTHWAGGYGAYFIWSPNNTFFHNNFIDNDKQVETSYPSVWDDGYPSSGNYWSDFEERYPDVRDDYSGPYQNQSGSDGIWDQFYWIENYNRDNYPFVNPCAPSVYHELVVFTSTTPDWIPLGDLFSINATVTNQGSIDETNVEFLLLINGTTADSTTIPLLKVGSSYTLSYPWTPTVKGEYNITAYVHPASGERWLKSNQLSRFISARARVRVGVKAGDWIKYDYTATSAPSGRAIPEWMKVEILAVERTNITLRYSMHLSNGTENNETLTLNFARYYNYYSCGTLDTLFGWCFVISANRTVGELSISIEIVPTYYEVTLDVNLDGETTRTYAGVSRTVVYSQWPGYLGGRYGSQPLKYYWDKQTGVLVEASVTIDGVPVTAKVTETNMWQAQSFGLPIDSTILYILIGVAVIAAATAFFAIRKKKKPTAEVEPTQSPKPS